MTYQIIHQEYSVEQQDGDNLQIPLEGIVKQIHTSLHADTHGEINQNQSMEGYYVRTIRWCESREQDTEEDKQYSRGYESEIYHEVTYVRGEKRIVNLQGRVGIAYIQYAVGGR